MKVAVLLYGQPRFIQENVENIKKEFWFKDCSEVEQTDFFCHFWDNVGYNVIDDITKEYEGVNFELLNKTLKPKSIVIENQDQIHKEAEILGEYIKLANSHISEVKNKFKTIYELTDGASLIGLLGQFTSIKKVTELLEEYESTYRIKYDLIIRIRTDLKFAPREIYSDGRQYWRDKYVYYIQMFSFFKKEGIFGEGLQAWKEPTRLEDNRIIPKEIISLNSVSFDEDQIFYQTNKNRPFNNTGCTLHLKDWVIYGDNKSMKTLNKQLYFNFLDSIHKDLTNLNRSRLTYEWGSGELITGNTIINHQLHTRRICFDWPNSVEKWMRFVKIQKQNKEKELHIKQEGGQSHVVYSNEDMNKAFYNLITPKPEIPYESLRDNTD